jgi:hypothetical protein
MRHEPLNHVLQRTQSFVASETRAFAIISICLFWVCLSGCKSSQVGTSATSEPAAKPKPAVFSEAWPYGSPSSYRARKALIDDGTLHDGMTKSEAEAILGRPTSEGNGVVEWYHNPGHLWHVAAYFRAKVRDEKLYEWETGNR